MAEENPNVILGKTHETITKVFAVANDKKKSIQTINSRIKTDTVLTTDDPQLAKLKVTAAQKKSLWTTFQAQMREKHEDRYATVVEQIRSNLDIWGDKFDSDDAMMLQCIIMAIKAYNCMGADKIPNDDADMMFYPLFGEEGIGSNSISWQLSLEGNPELRISLPSEKFEPSFPFSDIDWKFVLSILASLFDVTILACEPGMDNPAHTCVDYIQPFVTSNSGTRMLFGCVDVSKLLREKDPGFQWTYYEHKIKNLIDDDYNDVVKKFEKVVVLHTDDYSQFY